MEERSREEKDRDMQIAKTIMTQLGKGCCFMIGAKGKSWDEFRAAKVKNLERDVRNLQAKGVTVSGY